MTIILLWLAVMLNPTAQHGSYGTAQTTNQGIYSYQASTHTECGIETKGNPGIYCTTHPDL